MRRQSVKILPESHLRQLGATEGESSHSRDMAMAMCLQCGEASSVPEISTIDFHVSSLHLFVAKYESGTLPIVVLMS